MQSDEEPVQPIFDDSRSALEFALNASHAELPRPAMNKAMAEATKKRLSKLSKKRLAKALSKLDPDALELLELENAPKARKSSARPRPLAGLDRSHQAGFILSQLDRLDLIHKTTLKGLLIRAYDPCACRSACCSGWRRNSRWAEAVKIICTQIMSVGEITRTEAPGKKGLSTQPALRLAIVEQFFTKNSMTLTQIAQLGKVSMMTAARHRDWIVAYLEQTETESWLQIDAIFDQVGITGAFE